MVLGPIHRSLVVVHGCGKIALEKHSLGAQETKDEKNLDCILSRKRYAGQ